MLARAALVGLPADRLPGAHRTDVPVVRTPPGDERLERLEEPMMHPTHDEARIEVLVPSSFAPFVDMRSVSPNMIPLGEWPEEIYAGRLIRGLGERGAILTIEDPDDPDHPGS